MNLKVKQKSIKTVISLFRMWKKKEKNKYFMTGSPILETAFINKLYTYIYIYT